MKIAIVGAGGHGRTVEAALISTGGLMEWDFLDDAVVSCTRTEALDDPEFLKEHMVIVAMGNNHARRRLTERVIAVGGELVTARHLMSFVAPGAQIGGGSALLFGAHVGAGALLGRGCIVNNNASVGHGCRLGDYVNVCDGAILGGNVVVEDDVFIGLNATILPGVTIGALATVGAGAVVTVDVKAGVTVSGNPARPLINK